MDAVEVAQKMRETQNTILIRLCAIEEALTGTYPPSMPITTPMSAPAACITPTTSFGMPDAVTHGIPTTPTTRFLPPVSETLAHTTTTTPFLPPTTPPSLAPAPSSLAPAPSTQPPPTPSSLAPAPSTQLPPTPSSLAPAPST